MEEARRKKLQKILFFLIATVCLVLAYIGTALPGIPGTPFILLTAYFYLRSSDRMYNWLLKQKLFARLIHKFIQDDTIPLRVKISVLIPFWISIIVAEIFLVKNIWTGLSLVLLSILLSVVVLRLKKVNLGKKI